MEEKEGQWGPYYPIELGDAKLAFETKEEAQAFVEQCTTEGTLFTDDEGHTKAFKVVVYRKKKK